MINVSSFDDISFKYPFLYAICSLISNSLEYEILLNFCYLPCYKSLPFAYNCKNLEIEQCNFFLSNLFIS